MWSLLCASVAMLAACSSTAPSHRGHPGEVGVYDAGADAGFHNGQTGRDGSVVGGDNALTAHIEDIDKMTIELITLQCAGDCADVEAVAHGGNAPYTFRWEDGSTSAHRHVCPDANTSYVVAATDTSINDSEFAYSAHTVNASLTADVLSCADGGSCDLAKATLPQTGHYVGTIPSCSPQDMQVAVPTADGGSLFAGLAIDLTIDPSQPEQSGVLVGVWGVGSLIGFKVPLQGELDCSGELHATFAGDWGIPSSADPSNVTILPAGKTSGTLTVTRAPNLPDKITGDIFVDSVTDTGNGTPTHGTCTGTFSALRQ